MKLPPIINSPRSSYAKNVLYKYFYQAIAAFANFKRLNFKTLILLIILGIVAQGVQYYSYILFAESVGIHLSFAQLGAIRASLLLIANLPINFSIGISLRDVTLISMLVAIKVPLDKAAAMSIVVLVKTYTFGFIGGIIEAIGLIKKKKLVITSD